jgi:hypothetical protein
MHCAFPFTIRNGRRSPIAAAFLLALAGCATPSAQPETQNSKPETSSSAPSAADQSPAAQQALQEALRDFTCQGQPIHPALIHLFDGLEADDGPVIVAVDVHEARDSNQFFTPVLRNGPDIYCDLPDTNPPEHFQYRRLGALADGTQVLITSWNGGGSGNFENLLLVRFQLEAYRRPEGQRDWRLILREIEDFPLGDRDDGAITIESDRVIVGPSRYRAQPVIVTPDI